MGYGSSSKSMTFIKKRQRYEGGKNNHFDAVKCEAFSYNWWQYVAKIKGKVVFNNYSYSQSTNGHQSVCRSLLKELGIKIDLVVTQHQSLSKGIDLDPYYEAAALATVRSKALGMRASFYEDQKTVISESKEMIKKLRKAGGVMSRPGKKMKAFIEEAQSNETRRLETARIKSQEARAKKKALEEAHGAEFESLEAVAV